MDRTKLIKKLAQDAFRQSVAFVGAELSEDGETILNTTPEIEDDIRGIHYVYEKMQETSTVGDIPPERIQKILLGVAKLFEIEASKINKLDTH